MTYRKKLIEVALPLDAINAASAREKSIRHGHPSTLHLWWARRPLAACRAVLFAQLVDDPGSWPERFATEELQSAERERLHDLIRRLVPWEASNDERILNEARFEIARSFALHEGSLVEADYGIVRPFPAVPAFPGEFRVQGRAVPQPQLHHLTCGRVRCRSRTNASCTRRGPGRTRPT